MSTTNESWSPRGGRPRDRVHVLREGDTIDWLKNGQARLSIVLDADAANWFADHLPPEDAMTDTFRWIARELTPGG